MYQTDLTETKYYPIYKRGRHPAPSVTIYLINNTLAGVDVGFKVDTTSTPFPLSDDCRIFVDK